MKIEFKQTPNYTQNVVGYKKRGFVLHQTLGSYKGAVEWLMNSNRPNRSSAHYVIGRNEGEVIQLVKDNDLAWHAGNISNPAPYAKSFMLKNLDGTYVSPNKYLIGIEFASRYDVNGNGYVEPNEKDITDWQYRCAIEIINKNSGSIPVTPNMILVSHKEIADYKTDDTIFIREGLLKRLFPNNMVQIDCPVSKVDRVLAYMKSIN